MTEGGGAQAHRRSLILRRGGLAVLGGALLYLGHPPVGVSAAGFLALAPLIALARELRAESRRESFGWGFLAGLVAFGPLLYWLIPFGYAAFGLLTIVQSLFVGTFVTVLAAYGERRGRPVMAVSLWVALESLRSMWPLGGFSWGALAYTQGVGGPLLGVTRTIGTAGVSLVLVVISVALEESVRAGVVAWGQAGDTDVPADTVFSAMRAPIMTILGVLSVAVLLTGEAPTPNGTETSFGVVQGGDTRATSAAGVNRLDTGRIVRVTELMLEATEPFDDDPPDVVVWPENSLDRDVRTASGEEVAVLLDAALDLVAPSPILAGETVRGTAPGTVRNNMTVFRADGIGMSYSKQRPVPFAEYIPARRFLDWFPPLQQIPSDVVPGEGPQVIRIGDVRIGPIICFENTFPVIARQQVRAGAQVLVVSTNNSSFGMTPMSAQHLAFSRVRAVETGRWVIHAGISGISAFISPDGEVFDQTEQFEPAALRRVIPHIEGLTVAVRLGDSLVWLAWLVTIGGGLVALGFDRRARRSEEPKGGDGYKPTPPPK